MTTTLKYAGIAGIFFLVLMPTVILFESLRLFSKPEGDFSPYVLILAFILYTTYIYGFKLVGDKLSSNLLRYSAIVLMILGAVNALYRIFLGYTEYGLDNFSLFSLPVIGAASIILGISLLKLRSQIGSLAVWVGVLAIINGAIGIVNIISVFGPIFETASSLLLLLTIPFYILAYLLGSILLFKSSKRFEDLQNQGGSLSSVNTRWKVISVMIALVLITASLYAYSVFVGAKYLPEVMSAVKAEMGKKEARPGVDRVDNNKWTVRDGVVYFSVTSDGTTGEEWITRLESNGIGISDRAKEALRSPDFKPTSGVTTEVAVFKDIFVYGSLRLSEIRAEADKRNLTTPNAEVAGLILEKLTNEDIEAMGLWDIVVMHEPIKDSGGDPYLLDARRDFDGRWLGAYYGRPDHGWYRGFGFAFAVSQVGP